jgi:hypothetical protein
MDMRAYALTAADGAERWKTDKLYGEGFQSWWPVIWRDQVVLVTGHNYRAGLRPGSGSMPEQLPRGGGYYHDSEYRAIFGAEERTSPPAYIGPTGTEPGDWVAGTFTIDATKAAKYFGEKPWRQMTYFLSQASGENWGADLDGDGRIERAPFLWTGSKNGIAPPPMVSGFDNVLYRHNQYGTYQGIRSQLSGWKFGTPFVSRITRDYGASDEPHIASGGGRFIYWNLCGDRESGWIDISRPYTGNRALPHVAEPLRTELRAFLDAGAAAGVACGQLQQGHAISLDRPLQPRPAQQPRQPHQHLAQLHLHDPRAGAVSQRARDGEGARGGGRVQPRRALLVRLTLRGLFAGGDDPEPPRLFRRVRGQGLDPQGAARGTGQVPGRAGLRPRGLFLHPQPHQHSRGAISCGGVKALAARRA